MEMKNAAEQLADGDLSEQIKSATRESHVRTETTELMMSFQKGRVTLQQWKLLLWSLYEIYQTLEEALDENMNHPDVAPIYFPAELARLDAISADLEFFYGHEWREKIVVPAATERYCHRLRQVSKEKPVLLVAHAYTRYIGDLSGGLILGRMASKSLGLKNRRGLSFFDFPAVSSPNIFKQLYRSRMDSVELTEEDRGAVLEEAVRAFEFNFQVFEEIQKILRITDDMVPAGSTHSKLDEKLQFDGTMITQTPLFRMVLGLFIALATVGIGIYAL